MGLGSTPGGPHAKELRTSVWRNESSRSTINPRDLLRLTFGGGAGLAIGGLLDVRAMRAATKLSDVSEFTTSCNFCSCGCGMIATVRGGELVKMEGDYDHIVNRGSLCVKGISIPSFRRRPGCSALPYIEHQARL